MYTANPFTSAPALPRPKGHLHSRSISRSPARQHARDFDPLLRDLSPTTTLRAFVTDPQDMSDKEVDALTQSIQSSSVSERALGAKAAQACLDLRAWTRELENWQWPGTFDMPEPARKKARNSTMTFNSMFSVGTLADDEEAEYWGSLPAKTVKAYEQRADEIGHGLDQIDVEELKDYVLSSHYRVESRPQSRDGSIGGSSSAMTDLKKLDDYTAVVTATILHALPYLSKLNRLLDTWTIRLIILRSAANFLRDLKQARTDLDHGWAAIAVSSSTQSESRRAQFDRKNMQEMKTMIEAQVSSLGRRLDRYLDNLEGRDDSLPDAWIDDFELLESAYGTWVVQAERKVLENEWRASTGNAELSTQPVQTNGIAEAGGTNNHIAELEDTALDHDAVRQLSTDRNATLASSQQVSTSRDQAFGASTRKTCVSSAGKPAENVTSEMKALPIPILVSSDTTDNVDIDLRLQTQSLDMTRVPSSGSLSKEEGMGQVAKRRAQFMNDIERNQSLKTSKSPVRPFEHASNAFTRLFKKDRSPEQIKPKRSNSSKWGTKANADERSVSAERDPLSPPVSVASSKLNTASASNSPQAPATLYLSGPQVESSLQNIEQPSDQVQYDTGESHEEPPYHTPDHYREINEIMRDSQPSNLSSPFHSPDKVNPPKNWPLVSAADTPQDGKTSYQQEFLPASMSRERSNSGPEIDSPGIPLQTDAFDRMFIQSFPDLTEERPSTARARAAPSPWADSRKRGASLPRNIRKQMPELQDFAGSYLDMVSVNSRRPQSSPGHANRAESPDVPPVPRPSSQGQAKSDARITDHERVHDVKDASPTLKLKIPNDEVNSNVSYAKRPQPVKRASTASIEAFSRSQLKTIDVQRISRRPSASPAATPPQTPIRSRQSSITAAQNGPDAVDAGSMAYKGMVAFPSPPPQHHSRATPPSKAVPRQTPTVLQTLPDSSPARSDANNSPLQDENVSPSAPLNAGMMKRRGKSGLKIESSPPVSNGSHSQRKVFTRGTEEDTFDRHVSEVLQTLPGQIRFTPRAGAETPLLRTGDPRGHNGPRSRLSSRRSSKGGDGMTIAPAEASPKKSSSASEPEVKLYHLTTSGRDEPIKLFVRLVGEGERVMVRVGGGWADLADYLRQYAEHHGSRTVSEGNIEVQTVNSAPASRKVSGTSEINRAKSPVPPSHGTPRPSSKDSDHDWSFPVLSNGRSTPNPTGRQTPTLATTPKSSSGSSRPSTANGSRPPSRQGPGEVGLSGPSSGKKSALPEQKAKWVEGMIERAKQASAEKTKDDKQKYFGELGKAGGTRRVIFRSSSGTGERPK